MLSQRASQKAKGKGKVPNPSLRLRKIRRLKGIFKRMMIVFVVGKKAIGGVNARFI